MDSFFDFGDRQVIPLWRSFQSTIRTGELAPILPGSDSHFSDEDVADLVEDWRQEPTLPVASDLVAVAWHLGLDSVAIEAAQFIIASEKASPAARSIAMLYLKNAAIASDSHDWDGRILSERLYHAQVRKARQQ